jgi:hypothetical protein
LGLFSAQSVQRNRPVKGIFNHQTILKEALLMADKPTVIEAEYIFSFTGWPNVDTAGQVKGGPMGDRGIFHVLKGNFEGPKLKGEIVHPSGDWATLRSDGGLMLDVKLLLKTDDNVNILMQYRGIIRDEFKYIRIAPLFETDANNKKYNWLNNIQAIGYGKETGLGDGSLTFDLFALK